MPKRARALALIAMVEGLVACGGGASPTATRTPSPPVPSLSPGSIPDGWEVLTASPVSPNNGRHEDIFFLDASNGWLVNMRGEVYGTRDGGARWETLTGLPAGVFGRCVGFASTTRGWVGNFNTTNAPKADFALWETVDGGRTWANASTRISGAPVAGLCGMRVVDADTVVAVGRWNGPPVFIKTTDGGRTWTSRSLAGLASGLTDVHFFNSFDGIAVGAIGDGDSEPQQRAARAVILATADGGETWRTAYLGSATGQRAWKVDFPTAQVGYVSTEGIAAAGAILKTIDGGANWRTVSVSPGRSFEGIAFVDSERGWVAAGDTLFSTTDGGTSWKALNFGLNINRIRVVDDSLAYACGDAAYRWRP